MDEKEFEKIVISHAREIAEQIASTPRGWKKEVYWDEENDEVSFSDPMTTGSYTKHPDKIGVIEGLHDIPCDWGVEYCPECGQYHPVQYENGEMVFNHAIDAWDDLIDGLVEAIRDEPTAWVRPTLLLAETRPT